MNFGWYQTLGLGPNASEAEVRRAYRRLAKKFHPDVNPSAEAATKFLAISDAYENIVNSNRRDATRRISADKSRTAKTPHPDPRYSPQKPRADTSNQVQSSPLFHRAEFLLALGILLILLVQAPIRKALSVRYLHHYGETAWAEITGFEISPGLTLSVSISINLDENIQSRKYSFRQVNSRSLPTSPMGLPISDGDVYFTYYLSENPRVVFVDFEQPDSATLDRLVNRITLHMYSLMSKEGESKFKLGYCDCLSQEIMNKHGLSGLSKIWAANDIQDIEMLMYDEFQGIEVVCDKSY